MHHRGPSPELVSPFAKPTRRPTNTTVNFLVSPRRAPRLTSFTLFLKLPVEIRIIIWRLTLNSRVVEIEFTELRGFFTRVATPTALQVCRDSRRAVITFYPTCFGNIMYSPQIVFNFLLDTLYFDMSFHSQVLHFLASLKETEVKRIQSIAADSEMWFSWEYDGEVEVDVFSIIKKVVPTMVALKEFMLVFNAASWAELKAKEGSGPMELFPQWCENLWGCRYCECDCHWSTDDGDDELECDCATENRFCDAESVIQEVPFPGIKSVWGWRPTEDGVLIPVGRSITPLLERRLTQNHSQACLA